MNTHIANTSDSNADSSWTQTQSQLIGRNSSTIKATEIVNKGGVIASAENQKKEILEVFLKEAEERNWVVVVE